ncbi:FUSC family protein [Tunturiibacter gelidoferens]|uniref:Multidrug resistance protein MdtO n=1 Tax=Tunturiibacter gelidiferens TaxID=3069689 RepID=A0ACC5P3B1_9BACT|nr:FUSC family protein [Edaphobacter lichenicola]MBB5341201.1 multidrug resistance protein MdtO [Edaphobacter lichenicola]
MAANLSTWTARIWQDLQPTPGRWNSALRIVLASVIVLLLVMTLRMPFAGLGIFLVFLIGRDSPAVSFRSAILTLLTVTVAIAAVLAVVIVTDNDPMARVLGIAVACFLTGMFLMSSTAPGLAVIFGLVFAILMSPWETHTPAGPLVKEMLYLLGAVSLSVGSVVLVEYVFGRRNAAEELQKERITRYQALETMFSLYGQGADAMQLSPAVIQVSRLAVAGQYAMQRLYNIIVERNLDPSVLPIGVRVRITMQAQLLDVSAGFGLQYPTLSDPALRRRCAHIANLCHYLALDTVPPDLRQPLAEEHAVGPEPTLLDRVELVLHDIISMPMKGDLAASKKLIALPSREVPFLIPGALWQPQTIAFALKISLCATLCYIISLAVGWPGISTSIITVFITGLGTSGAIKQRLIFRLAGSVIGGLIFALGATVFLFPLMDSITSLVLLVTVVTFFSAWLVGGRQFNFVGVQTAFSFDLVVFAGFSAPTELAPPRDRLVGILLALVIMAFVFDLIWPVRNVTAMRSSLATILRGVGVLLRESTAARTTAEFLGPADSFRDLVGKTVASIRTMNDTIEYEFGVDRIQHQHAGDIILRASLTAVAFFWNGYAVLHREQDRDFLTEPGLIKMRAILANGMDAMAQSVVRKTDLARIEPAALIDGSLLTHPRYGEYVQNAIARFEELQKFVTQLRTEP